MRTVKIDRDMDYAGMSDMRKLFDELAQSSDDVCLDLSQVRFLDSAGVDELVSLYRVLHRRSLKLAIIHMDGQPLRVLRELLLGQLAAR
jgi:anti-anti-sigma factor